MEILDLAREPPSFRCARPPLLYSADYQENGTLALPRAPSPRATPGHSAMESGRYGRPDASAVSD